MSEWGQEFWVDALALRYRRKSEIEDISGFSFSLKFMPHTRGNIRFLKYFNVRRQTLVGVSIYVFIAYIRELFRI